MTLFDIAILGFAVAGFLFALFITLTIRDVARDVNEIIRRDDEDRAEREKNAFVPVSEPTPLPQKLPRIRSMHGDYR